MNSRERARAQRDLERCVAALLKKGWTLEEISTTDARNEDYRATITLTIAGYEPERKGVM